jgi:hypothetical protein
MAISLWFCQNHFGNNLWQIWQLAVVIATGLLVYFGSAYATGCLNYHFHKLK